MCLSLTAPNYPSNSSPSEPSIPHRDADQILQPPLCRTVINLYPGGRRTRNLLIDQPQIKERVYDLLRDKSRREFWDVAHALRDLRREFLTSGSLLLQDVDWILKEVDDNIRSDLQDFTERKVTSPDNRHITPLHETNLWIFYSIIMLSYGAKATLTSSGSAHIAYLEDMLLGETCDEVVLSFDDVERVNYRYGINISDLPRLEDYGIELDLAPFRNLLSAFDTQSWCNHPHQMPSTLQEHNPEPRGKFLRLID